MRTTRSQSICVHLRHVHAQHFPHGAGAGRSDLDQPPLEAPPGPGAASMTGLDAYCSLMRACWEGEPRQRPTLEPVVVQLSDAQGSCAVGLPGMRMQL